MTALEFYKFYKDNHLEYHWNDEKDVMLFVDTPAIAEFMILTKADKKEEGWDCVMKGGYLCFWVGDICDYFGIEITDVFPR